MRNEKTWEKKVKQKYISKLSLRIQEDLKKIKPPKNLPKELVSTFIFGKTHTGKTLRSVFMLLKAQKSYYLAGKETSCIFVSLPNLLEQIKATFHNSSYSDSEILDYYRDIDLLVLDDLGTDCTTNWFYQVLYSLINYRYEYMKKTIITSNLSLEELASLFGDDRITSRIERMCIIEEKINYKK